MVLRLSTILAVVLVSCANGQVIGQQVPATTSTPAETIIRSETRLVLVDAVAVDKKNKFIRDLTQKDFRIWEDGHEQKISNFSLESAGVSPQRTSKHYIVLFFDTSTLSAAASLSIRQDAVRFIDTFASPDRYMAVVAYGSSVQIVQNFTADASRLKTALTQMRNSNSVAPGIPQVNNGPFGGRGNRAPAGDAGGNLRRMLAGVRNVADSIATVRGRKALVLFSGGATTGDDVSADVTATIGACNKANVAVYGVSGQGLIGKSTRPSNRGITALGFQRGIGGAIGGGGLSVDASGSSINTSVSNPGQNVLRLLAAGTGGLILGSSLGVSSDLPDALGSIAQEQDEYYLIGYTPAVESPEGSCHVLLVKVARGGAVVRARKGYCTSKAVDPLNARPAGKDLEARAGGKTPGNISATIQLPWFYAEPNVARVTLVMDIVPAAVRFQKNNNTFHGEFDLAGVAYKADGSVAARLSDTVKVNFDTEQQADAFLKAPYHYQNTFEILPGKYDFRVALGAGDHGFGKVEMPLTIGPWAGSTMGLSGLALSHESHPAVGLIDGLDDSLLEGAHPLISRGKELMPAGTSQFHAGEPSLFYFEVYEPRTAPTAPSVRIRILDRATGQQKDDSGPIPIAGYRRPGNPVIPIIMALPTAGLASGAYKLEVSLDDLVRTADFDVN